MDLGEYAEDQMRRIDEDRDNRIRNEGKKAVWLSILNQAMGALNFLGAGDDPVVQLAASQAELDLTMDAIKEIAFDHDLDMGWPDGLHLSDVIEKHVRPQLKELFEEEEE